ncbi:4a-hydroxytetrahydrobiopterin dehydratase [Halorubrum gandharaense]
MPDVLDDDAIDRNLPDGWHREENEVVRSYQFDDYLDGVTFANAVAEVAEEEQHHPTIVIGYGEVTVRFTTHEADGITNRDIRLAGLCNDEF